MKAKYCEDCTFYEQGIGKRGKCRCSEAKGIIWGKTECTFKQRRYIDGITIPQIEK